jgi:Tfp pilus tip-associated adhesin PilY1
VGLASLPPVRRQHGGYGARHHAPDAVRVHTVAPSGTASTTRCAPAWPAPATYSANSPGSLRNSLAAVFEDLSKEASAGTGVGFSNTTIAAGEMLVQSGFFTNTWEGYVQAVDSKAQLDFLNGVGPQPLPLWTVNFPAPAARNITTSTAQTTAVNFDWCSLSAAQQTAIDPVAAATACPAATPNIMNYLRGDTTLERRFPLGVFRDRRGATVLGDVVNSSPQLSKAADHAYHMQPAASYSAAGTDGFTEYRNCLTARRQPWPTVLFERRRDVPHPGCARWTTHERAGTLCLRAPRRLFAPPWPRRSGLLPPIHR